MPDFVGSVSVWTETFKCELPKLKHIIKYFAERYGTVSISTCLTSMNHMLVIWEHELFFYAKYKCKLEGRRKILEVSRHWL
jgi:hypothetical protein